MMRPKATIAAIAIACTPFVSHAAGRTLFRPGLVAPVDETAAPSGPVLRTGRLVVDRTALERSEVTLHLFEDVLYVARRVGSEEGRFGHIWFGELADPARGSVTAVVTAKGVTAEVRLAGRVFLVYPDPSGTHVVQEIDPQRYPPEECLPPDAPGAAVATPGGVPGSVVRGVLSGPAGPDATVDPLAVLACPSPPPPPPPPPPGVDIDVLIPYSDDVAQVYGDVPAMAELAVVLTNRAYFRSQIHQRLRLLDARLVVYTETDSQGNPRDHLGNLDNANDPQLGIIHTWMEECGADLVDLWVWNSSYCGIAHTKSSACEAETFSVTNAGCAVGGYSFAHELGHNMGAQHDHVTGGSTPAYPFSYGFRILELGFRTIMAYDDPDDPFCCTRIPFFSNPYVCVAAGNPGWELCDCGTPNCYPTGIPAGPPDAADNAQTLNLTKDQVAAQRTATGACTAFACTSDAECSDGEFCNGQEWCVNDYCAIGANPCPVRCREEDDTCVQCLNDADCDDGLFCNGVESCDEPSGNCQYGSNPCEGLSCKEPLDICTQGPMVWLSFLDKTTVPGVGNVENEDIVARDAVTGAWSLVFDGSDVGLGGLTIDGMAVLDSGDILLSFTDSKTIPGMIGGPAGSTTLDDSDIVRFVPTSLGTVTAGSFVFYFDGSDVGLTTNDEDIDAIGLDALDRLVLSTVGPFTTADGVSGADTDLFLFTAGGLGEGTYGAFSMYIDGSDVGLTDGGNEDIDGCALTNDRKILLSTVGTVAVPGVTGEDEDILRLQPTAYGNDTSGIWTLYLDLSTIGIATSEDVTAIEYLP